MPKQSKPQRYVFKIPSPVLRKSRWDLSMTIEEGRQKGYFVSLADSQMFRFIDSIRGNVNADKDAMTLKARIRDVATQQPTISNRELIKGLRARLDSVMYHPDYLLVQMKNNKDHERACQGFSFNGVKYKFMFATVGGVKTSTVTFIAEEIFNRIWERVNNGRDMSKEFAPSKLEAYMSLVCSASVPVSAPYGVLVVDDCVTHFRENVIHIKDGESEPELTYVDDFDVELTDSDGYGLMIPTLARRWSNELNENGIMSGFCCRCAFTKGMLFTFDFRKFANEVAHNSIVKDVWGVEHDVNNIEVILTTSMLKLWDSYSSWDDYWHKCYQNEFTFAATKVCPEELEDMRTTNYQFIQPYDISDADVQELVQPTIDNIKDVDGGDWAKTLLYLKGTKIKDSDVLYANDDFVKALTICPEVINDVYVKGAIKSTLKRRIDNAKIGVLDVNGNYSIISGDPYSLCQHIFGMDVTGLLKAGELYNKHWLDKGVQEVVCFRAPMSCGNNIRKLKVSSDEQCQQWYEYMKTCTILNSWDSTCHALNGADKDSDAILTTNNRVLLENAPNLPTIMCEQRKASKKIVSQSDFITANIAAAGNDIGAITNRVTAMYDKLTMLKDPAALDTLNYRIMCGQNFQQNAIDKAKGIIAEPMPSKWYDFRPLKLNDEDDEETTKAKTFDRELVVNCKPYFMRYVYPDLMSKWKSFVRNAEAHALREFRLDVATLKSMVASGDATPEQTKFVSNYEKYLPVSDGKCVVNRVCRYVESAFEHSDSKDISLFDYHVFQSDDGFKESHCKQLRQLYKSFSRDCQNLIKENERNGVDGFEASQMRRVLVEYYIDKCHEICSNERLLCNAMVETFYADGNSNGKRFVWDVVANQIIKNLLHNSGNKMMYPVKDKYGSIEYHGERFSIKEINVEEKA